MEHPLSHVFVQLINAIAKASQVNLDTYIAEIPAIFNDSSHHGNRSTWLAITLVSLNFTSACFTPHIPPVPPKLQSLHSLERKATDARSRRPPHRRALASGASSHLEGLRGMPKAQDQVYRPVAHAVRLLPPEAITLRLPFSSPHSPPRQCIASSSQCHLPSPNEQYRPRV
jgi:hypothetical protein